MRYIITVCFFFSLVHICGAQQSNYTDGELMQMSDGLNPNNIFTYQSRDVKGDPYFNPDFLKGKIMLNDRSETSTKLLRYNTEHNMLEYIEGEKYYGLQPGKISGFTFYSDPKNIVFKNGFESEEYAINKDMMLRVIYEGPSTFLALHTTSLKKDLASYGSAQKKDAYVDDVSYYFIDKSEHMSRVKLKKSDILRVMNQQLVNRIESYMKTNKLGFDDEEDVSTIFTRYDYLNSED